MKTSPIRIASRYVHALFDVAVKQGVVAAVEKDLKLLTEAFAHNSELKNFMANPLLSREQQECGMHALLTGMQAHAATQKFITLLARQKRLPILPEIAALFSERVEEARGEISAKLVAARPLSPQALSAISDHLAKVYGKKVNLQVSEDESLLGGFIITIGSKQFDSSLAGKLKRLERQLKAA